MDVDSIRNSLRAMIGDMPLARVLRGEESMPTVNSLKERLKAMPVFQNTPEANQSAMDVAMNFGPAALGKIVYHGSPHKFDKFDASKIGTGEGAQAYGHGVYLADAPDVAQSYTKGGGAFQKSSPVPNVMIGDKWAQTMPRDSLESQAATVFANDLFGATIPEKVKKLRSAKMEPVADFLEKNADQFRLSNGEFYKADLPDEWIPKMLDWDKPLSQQPESVRLLAQDFGLSGNATGKDIYYALSNQARDIGIIKGQPLQTTLPGSQEKATADLLGFGIPGIRYMDGGSRMTPTQEESIKKALERAMARGDEGVANSLRAQLENRTSNYVVFPGLEDQVKILERNGQPVNALLEMSAK